MRTFTAILTLLSVLVGCTGGKKEIAKPSNIEIMSPRCVGRTVISLPRNFNASSVTTGTFRSAGAGATEPAFEMIVRADKYSKEKFLDEVQKRRLALQSGGNERVNVLRLDKELADGTVLLRLQAISDAYVSEVNFLRSESMVTVTLESYGNQFLRAEEELLKFVAGITSMNQVEQNGGFCLGTVEIAGKFAVEQGSFWFRDGHGADFEIDIDTYASNSQVHLLERMTSPDSLLTVFDVKHKVLRARDRMAGGMQAQEWLGWAKLTEAQDEKTLKFTLETIRSKPGRTAPSITLTFNTAKPQDDGTPTKTQISDDEAMQLWDAVVESIRPAMTD